MVDCRLLAHCFFKENENFFMMRILLVLHLMFFCAVATAVIDPAIDWQMFSTEHFTLIYDSKQRSLAELYARAAEQAFAAAAPVFHEWPNKTVIVINDNTDLANGFAVGVPYPLISAFPVLPTSLDSISDYGNWGVELLTHEYTHILTFEPAHGVMRPFRLLFGSLIRTNMYLPRWYLEGLAVEMETLYSRFGRLRSANYLSIARALSEEGALRHEDIARINEAGIPDWPGGIRPYLMGALLWNEMVAKGGEHIIGDLNNDYSRRVPFFIDPPVRARLGLDYQGLLDKAYDRIEAQTKKQIDLVHAAGQITGQFIGVKLIQDGFFSHSPQISPDGNKLVFVAHTHNLDSILEMIERPTGATTSFRAGKSQTLTTGTSTQRVSWFPDSNQLVYDSVDRFGHYYEFSDLYKYDLSLKHRTQLTFGLRAREPVVAPDGRSIYFVQVTAGGTRLARVNADGSGFQVLYAPPLQIRISRPEFLNEHELLFNEKREDGAEIFRVLTLDQNPTPQFRDVLSAFRPVHFARMTPKGLIFISDKSGIANLYLANRDLSDAQAISNATTRLMTGELDPRTDDLYYSRLDGDGPMIYLTERANWQDKNFVPPQVGPLVDYDWPHFTPPQVADTAIGDMKPDSYSAWPYLLPHYWYPFVYFIPGGTWFSANTAGNDPLDKHDYTIAGTYDTLTAHPSVYGVYKNSTTRVPITLTATDSYQFFYGGNFPIHNSSVGALGGFFLPNFNRAEKQSSTEGVVNTFSDKWRGGLGWQYAQTELLNDRLIRQGPQAEVTYTDVAQHGLEISPEKGGAFSLSHTRYLPSLGNTDYDQTDFRGSIYFSKWLPPRHVLAAFFNATVAPRLRSSLFGRTTVGGNYSSTLTQNAFTMRGYGPGEFIGRNMLNASLEYRLPLSYQYRGYGTVPFFIQRWHGALVFDGVTEDGLFFDFNSQNYRSASLGTTYFFGTGAELHAVVTAFYNLPLTMTFGLYYGLDQRAGGIYPFIGLGL